MFERKCPNYEGCNHTWYSNINPIAVNGRDALLKHEHGFITAISRYLQ